MRFFRDFKTERTVNRETSKAKSIDDNAYSANRNIKRISATYATNIGKKAFAGCINLKEVFLGPDIRKIDALAFAHCTSLTDVWFPMLDRNATVEIAEDAFISCNKICFHIFGYSSTNCGNKAIEEYAKKHNFELIGMI